MLRRVKWPWGNVVYVLFVLLIPVCAKVWGERSHANFIHSIYGNLLTEGIDTDNPRLVERALSQGENINRHGSVTGGTPLMEAAALKENRALEVLLRRGADVNARSNHGGTALMMAAVAGNLSGEKMLLDHGAAVNAQGSDGCTALYHAVNHRNVEAVRMLLAHGADPTKPTRKGRTPFDLAAQKYEFTGDMSGHITNTSLDPAARQRLTEIAALLKQASAHR